MCSETTKEELLHKFINDLWDNQIPPDLEFDNIIHDSIWELYDYGFPK